MRVSLRRTCPRAAALAIACGALLLAALVPASASADFGVEPGSFTAGSLTEAGEPDTRAAAHPFAAVTSFSFRTEPGTVEPEGWLRDAVVELPPGFVGNPNATPRCAMGNFFGGGVALGEGNCPYYSVVGYAELELCLASLAPRPCAVPAHPEERPARTRVPIYNLVPRPGELAAFGFYVQIVPTVIHVSVRTGSDYGVTATVSSLEQAGRILYNKVVLWGVPADSSHAALREFSCTNVGKPNEHCNGAENIPTNPPPLRPLLTDPAACEGHPLSTTLRVDSWEAPGLFDTATAEAPEPTGCAEVPFNPSISVTPETTQAGAPTGLTFDLRLPQSEDPAGRGTSPLKQAVVTLPEGMTMSPPAAAGLDGCAPSQIGLHSESPATCPAASKLGTVRVESPDLPEGTGGEEGALTGFAYLGRPEGGLDTGPPYPLYLDVTGYGLDVKLEGKVEPDPRTGQITTTFADNPPLPFDHLTLRIKGGPHAALVNPPACGPQVTTSSLSPWSAPGDPRHPTSTFTTTGPCPSTPPFSPAVQAGTEEATAAATSPFHFRLTRADGEQALSAVDVKLPPGLTAYLRGVPYCPEAAITTAIASSGSAEAAAPACPASQIGTAQSGAGAGPDPYYVSGRVYLAGPYKGAPLSMVIVTPALAGPFDLGDVVVRAGLYVDLETAEITAKSDPIPQILGGVPLQLRSVAIDVDRPDFTLNPSSCKPLGIDTTAFSAFGADAGVATRFQVGGCDKLSFKPHLKLRLKGATKRAGHPALKAVVTYPKGGAYANIARAQVGLPHSEFLDQRNLNKVCKQADLRAGTCPASSIYGHAKAWTPLLDKPLEGPVYLGVGFGYKLPALVADLSGQVRILLVGKVDTTKRKGIRNTFEAVPDAPVSRFVLEMKGGKKYGLLENSENLCRKSQRASALFDAQNGLQLHLRPKVANSCKRPGHESPSKGHGRQRSS